MSAERTGFDKISYELGENSNGLKNLEKLFEQHCEDDDRRHVENVKLLTDNNAAIKALSDALAPIAANYVLNRKRLALLATVGFGILLGLSWVAEAGLKWAVGWLLKIKFGG